MACAEKKPPPPTSQAPVVLKGVQLREMSKGKVLWRGHAQSVSGTLSQSAVKTIQMTHEREGGQPIQIFAKEGTMDFDGGLGELQEIRVVRHPQEVLTAPKARFEQESQIIHADGPLTVDSPTLKLKAQSAQVQLESATMTIQGPVTGRWLPTPQTQQTP